MKKIILLCMLAIFISACSGTAEVDDPLSLSVGIMPSMDAAPILLAKEKGYFDDVGLDADIRIYTNANDRDTEINSNLVDGVVSDILGLITNRKSGFAVRATSSTDTVMPVLINENSTDKTEVNVGMGEVSVTNYLSDRYLANFVVTKQFISAIPQRMEMAVSGTIDMAIIPEPMASQGELSGLIKEVMPISDAYSPNILMFTEEAIENKEEAIRAFYEAYNQAAEEIESDNAEARAILVEDLGLNPDIRDLITFPTYHSAQLFDTNHFDAMASWIADNLDIEVEGVYSDHIDDRFVP